MQRRGRIIRRHGRIERRSYSKSKGWEGVTQGEIEYELTSKTSWLISLPFQTTKHHINFVNVNPSHPTNVQKMVGFKHGTNAIYHPKFANSDTSSYLQIPRPYCRLHQINHFDFLAIYNTNKAIKKNLSGSNETKRTKGRWRENRRINGKEWNEEKKWMRRRLVQFFVAEACTLKGIYLWGSSTREGAMRIGAQRSSCVEGGQNSSKSNITRVHGNTKARGASIPK